MVPRFDVCRYDSVSSTMDLAAAEAARGASEWRVIVAAGQTAGRGRRGRAWMSPPGAGLYLSAILRPPVDPPGDARLLPLLTLAAGVGVREGLTAATGLSPSLKWPNDLLVGARKLGGILAEGLAIGTSRQAVIVGVGINVQPAPYDPDVARVATSVEAELGRPVDRDDLLWSVLEGLSAAYDDLRGGRAGDILRRWRLAAPGASGAHVEWEGQGGMRCTGVTAGIDDEGALLVRTPRGTERLVGGEVRWR
jgi:BirA family biotin operon repressor/biotin-[acetyl-CoA-carboxylase] ligase